MALCWVCPALAYSYKTLFALGIQFPVEVRVYTDLSNALGVNLWHCLHKQKYDYFSLISVFYNM